MNGVVCSNEPTENYQLNLQHFFIFCPAHNLTAFAHSHLKVQFSETTFTISCRSNTTRHTVIISDQLVIIIEHLASFNRRNFPSDEDVRLKSTLSGPEVNQLAINTTSVLILSVSLVSFLLGNNKRTRSCPAVLEMIADCLKMSLMKKLY